MSVSLASSSTLTWISLVWQQRKAYCSMHLAFSVVQDRCLPSVFTSEQLSPSARNKSPICHQDLLSGTAPLTNSFITKWTVVTAITSLTHTVQCYHLFLKYNFFYFSWFISYLCSTMVSNLQKRSHSVTLCLSMNYILSYMYSMFINTHWNHKKLRHNFAHWHSVVLLSSLQFLAIIITMTKYFIRFITFF